MEKVLFSIPMFRGTKGKKTFIYTNFYQALDGMIKEKLFYLEYFADMNFYINGCKKTLRPRIKRIYFAEIKPYKYLRSKAIADKWLKVPNDFMYDKKYQYQDFLFSKKAREIGEIYEGEFITLGEDYWALLNHEKSIELTEEQQVISDSVVIQKDKEFYIGDGSHFKAVSKEKDFNSALEKLQNNPKMFYSLKIVSINYKMDGRRKHIKWICIYAKEDKISPREALKKSNNAPKILEAIKKGETNFIFNAQRNLVIVAHNALFVPKDTILNKWKF